MKLADLSKPQWDAALNAARCLVEGDPNDAADRAAFREAKAGLTSILPPSADARGIINQAIRWDALNTLAGAFLMIDDRVLVR